MANKILKLFFISLMLFQTISVFAQEDESTDVVSVNGTMISSFDVKREMNMMYQQALQQGVYPDDSEIGAYWNTAVNALVGRELLYQDALSREYSADPAAVDEYINALTMNYGGSEQLEQALSAQGMDLEKLRADTVKYEIISDYVGAEFRPKISVSEEDVLAYYTENKEHFKTEETVTASHILVKTEDSTDEAEVKAALEKITEIREQIVNGEDFAELAKEVSDCPSGANGGSLGEFGHGQMVPPFDRAVFALEEGELSEPVLTQFGYHIILCDAVTPAATVAYEDVKERLSSYLTDIKLDEYVTGYVAQLREAADIKLF